MDCKEIKPISHKGNQSWIFIGRTDVGAEAPILWPPNVKSWLIGKDPDAEKDWKQEEKGITDDKTTQRTWVWANSRRWWRKKKPDMLSKVCHSFLSKEQGSFNFMPVIAKSWTILSDWTMTTSRFLEWIQWILAMKANKLLVIYFLTEAVIKIKMITLC